MAPTCRSRQDSTTGAGRRAQEAIMKFGSSPVIALRLPAMCDLIIDGKNVTIKRSYAIREALGRFRMIPRLGWTEATFDSICWRAFGMAFRKLPPAKQCFATIMYSQLLRNCYTRTQRQPYSAALVVGRYWNQNNTCLCVTDIPNGE